MEADTRCLIGFADQRLRHKPANGRGYAARARGLLVLVVHLQPIHTLQLPQHP